MFEMLVDINIKDRVPMYNIVKTTLRVRGQYLGQQYY